MMHFPPASYGAPLENRQPKLGRIRKRFGVGLVLLNRGIGVTVLITALALLVASERVALRYGSAVELALQLAAFCFACFGLLLVIEGKSMRRRWQSHTTPGRPPRRAEDVPPLPAIELDPALLAAGMAGGRNALTAFLIVRAQQDAACRRAQPKTACRERH